MRQKIAMVLAVICLVVSIPTVSYAAEGDNAVNTEAVVNPGETAEPYYINTANIAAPFKIEGNTAYCRAEVTAKKVCFITVIMRLQQKTGNSSWYTKTSWVSSSTTGIKNMTKTRTLTERGTYRVELVATVGGEEVTCTSVTKTY